MIYDLLKDVDKEYLYDSYKRIVDDPKAYKKINCKEIIEDSLNYYDSYNKLLSICSYEEIRLLNRIIKKEIDFDELILNRNLDDLRSKFLVVIDPSKKNIIIDEKIVPIIKEAYKKMNKEHEEKKETLNIILIGLLRIYGMLSFNDLYNILINYIVIDKEVLKEHLNNKYFNYNVEKVTYKKKEYYIYRTYNMFIDVLYQGINSFKDMDYFLRPFEEIVYLRFNNFNDMNKEVTSFIHKMNSYNIDLTKLFNEITMCTVLDLDRDDIIKHMKELIKDKDIDKTIDLLNKAMDNMPSACLKGYTRKEYLDKISEDKYNEEYDKIRYDNRIIEYKEIREKSSTVINEAMYYVFKEKLSDKFNDVIKDNNIFFYETDTHVVENLVLFHSIDKDKTNFDIFYDKKVTIFFPYYEMFKEYKDSYIEGLFQITNINPKEGFVTLKSTFSKREYKVYDVALSLNKNFKNYYIYTSLVTVDNYTFTTNYAFVIKDYNKDDIDKRIKSFKGIESDSTKNFLAFYEAYRDQDISIASRNLE